MEIYISYLPSVEWLDKKIKVNHKYNPIYNFLFFYLKSVLNLGALSHK